MHPTRPGPPVADAPGPPFYGGPDTPVCKQIKKGGAIPLHEPTPPRTEFGSTRTREEKKKMERRLLCATPSPRPRRRGAGEMSSSRRRRGRGGADPLRRVEGHRKRDGLRPLLPAEPLGLEGGAPPPQRRRPPARHLRALPGGDQAASWAARSRERTTGCLSLGTKSSRKALGSWGCAGGPHRTSSTRKPLKQAHTRRRLGKFGREQRSRGPRKGVTLSPPCPRSAFREEPVSEAVNSASQAEPQLLR